MAFSRRDFLLRSAGFVTVSAMVAEVGRRRARRGSRSRSESDAPRRTGRSSILELMGGNDGLNTVIPYADTKYPQVRSRIGIPVGTVLPLDAQLGLNPQMTGLKSLWDANRRRGRRERRISQLEPLALRVARHLAHGRPDARAASRLARPLGRRDDRGQRQPALLHRDHPVASAHAPRRQRPGPVVL